MPSKSKSQQRLMGWALCYKRGDCPEAPKNIRDIADGMSIEQLEDYMKMDEILTYDEYVNKNYK